MQIEKFVVIATNIFGRQSRNIYIPKSNEEYWNFTQNMIDSNISRFFIESIDDLGAMEEISRGYSDSEFIDLLMNQGVLGVIEQR